MDEMNSNNIFGNYNTDSVENKPEEVKEEVNYMDIPVMGNSTNEIKSEEVGSFNASSIFGEGDLTYNNEEVKTESVPTYEAPTFETPTVEPQAPMFGMQPETQEVTPSYPSVEPSETVIQEATYNEFPNMPNNSYAEMTNDTTPTYPNYADVTNNVTAPYTEPNYTEMPSNDTTYTPNESYTEFNNEQATVGAAEVSFKGINESGDHEELKTLENGPTYAEIEKNRNMKPIDQGKDENSGLKLLLGLGILFAIVIILLPFL